ALVALLLPVPQPFSLELTTARFRAFGLERATVWEDGALYRAVGGREVRIAAAEGGVEVDPLDAETEAVARKLLGFDFDLVAFSAWASGEELCSIGFSRRKAEYVIGLARSDLDLAGLALLSDEEVKAQLTALRGLGEWTADWFLARYLARPRAWPAGDLALRKAVRALYGDVDVRAAGARFEPFQNLTAHYLLAQFL